MRDFHNTVRVWRKIELKFPNKVRPPRLVPAKNGALNDANKLASASASSSLRAADKSAHDEANDGLKKQEGVGFNNRSNDDDEEDEDDEYDDDGQGDRADDFAGTVLSVTVPCWPQGLDASRRSHFCCESRSSVRLGLSASPRRRRQHPHLPRLKRSKGPTVPVTVVQELRVSRSRSCRGARVLKSRSAPRAPRTCGSGAQTTTWTTAQEQALLEWCRSCCRCVRWRFLPPVPVTSGRYLGPQPRLLHLLARFPQCQGEVFNPPMMLAAAAAAASQEQQMTPRPWRNLSTWVSMLRVLKSR